LVIGCDDGWVRALDARGTNYHKQGYPPGVKYQWDCRDGVWNTCDAVSTTPLITDLEKSGPGSGIADIIVGNDQGIWILNVDGSTPWNPSMAPWPMFHRNPARTGSLEDFTWAQDRGSICGIAKYAGSPVGGATLHLWYAGYPRKERTSVSDGRYAFSNLQTNLVYDIYAEDGSGHSKWVRGVHVQGLTQLRLDIDLE